MGTNNSAATAANNANNAREQAGITNPVNQIDAAYNSPQRAAQIGSYGTMI